LIYRERDDAKTNNIYSKRQRRIAAVFRRALTVLPPQPPLEFPQNPQLKHRLLVLPRAFLYADVAAKRKAEAEHMRLSIKRIFRKKERTPEQIERAYRQMLAEKEAQKRDAHWVSLTMRVPKI
jgi:hypothetical protein